MSYILPLITNVFVDFRFVSEIIEIQLASCGNWVSVNLYLGIITIKFITVISDFNINVFVLSDKVQIFI